MNRNRFARRQFLRGAGVTVTLPFLEALAPRMALASAPSVPRRVLFYIHHQGTIADTWTPSTVGPLGTLPELLAPLQSLKDDIAVVSGIDNSMGAYYLAADGHQSVLNSMMTCQPYVENINPDGSLVGPSGQVGNGVPAGPSIDQVVAQRVGGNTQFASLNVGFGNPSWYSRLCYAAVNDPVMVDVDPYLIHERLFSNIDPSEDPPELTPIQRLRMQRKSVLDAVSGGLGRLQSQLGGEDRQRLEAHAEKIRELEKTLESGSNPGVGCTEPQLSLPNNFDPGHSNFDHISSPTMNMLMAMALACDVSRVITIEHLEYHEPLFPFVDGVDIPGSYTDWHAMVHEGMNGSDRATIQRVLTFYSEQFADLVQRLKDTPEGEGNMLDHTLVVWMSDFGDGSVHSPEKIPVVLAGNLGGIIPVGQHVSYAGHSIGDLFTSVLRLMGEDDELFGRPEFCTGPLPGLE
ncbi:MAG: DUF1552 domain-containing protein [Myxococcales bacterium FL481]|nr:MAG: DUF1552 domain-containing protein [Myxococcales bacterium FL481]